MTPNIADTIRHHVSLEVRCIDRIYLHAYMPKLQPSGGLCYFLHDYLGHPVPSPALLKPRHDGFVAAVQQFAQHHDVPFVPFERGESKDAFVAPYRTRFTAQDGVVLRPNWAALLPEDDALPRSLREALNHLDTEIQKLHEEAAIAA